MPPDRDLETLAAQVRSLVESASPSKTWFARIARAWSPERQATEQTLLAAILALTAELKRKSAAHQELANRHSEELTRESAARQEMADRHTISEGNVRALFASLQATAASTEEVGKEVVTLKTELERELPEIGRRLSDVRADLRTIENSASIQTGKLVETRHELDRALEQIVAIRSSILEQAGRIGAMQAGLVDQFGQVARDLDESRALWKQQVERIDAALISESGRMEEMFRNSANRTDEAHRGIQAQIDGLSVNLEATHQDSNKRDARIAAIDMALSELTARTNATVVSLMASITSAREATSQEAEGIKNRINLDRHEFEARADRQDAALAGQRAESSARLSEAEAELARVGEYARSVRAQLTTLAAEVRRPIEAIQQSAPSALDQSGGSRGEALPQLNARLAGIESSATTLRDVLAGLAQTSLRGEALSIEQNRQQSLFERFYLAFENKYRGSMAEIRIRQQELVPFVERIGALQTIPPKEAVIIDLGCGRGEWLDLLRATGFERAVGIDSNAEMVNVCRKRSLTVEHTDAIAFLGRQPDKSVVAITGFHIIEHLPFPVVLDLMIEARRVLAKTGVLIFETPNPENALVATRTFHLDPTHRAPIPPQLLAFAMEHAGFSDVQILRLHPYSAEHLVKGNSAVAARFNEFFFCAQDYAVVGCNA